VAAAGERVLVGGDRGDLGGDGGLFIVSWQSGRGGTVSDFAQRLGVGLWKNTLLSYGLSSNAAAPNQLNIVDMTEWAW
jgi:hypothetical protein